MTYSSCLRDALSHFKYSAMNSRVMGHQTCHNRATDVPVVHQASEGDNLRLAVHNRVGAGIQLIVGKLSAGISHMHTSAHCTLAMCPSRVRSSQLASYSFGPANTTICQSRWMCKGAMVAACAKRHATSNQMSL